MAYAKVVGKLDLYNLAKRNGVAMRTIAKYMPALNVNNSGLVGWWKFDEASGTSAADSTGNGNIGTLVNTPTWVAGKINNALQLVSASSQRVTVPYSASFNVNSFTVSAWFYNSDTSGTYGIFGTRTGGDNTFDLKIQAQSNGINFQADLGNGTSWLSTSLNVGSLGTTTCPLNTWNHVAYVIDNAAQKVYIYVNGVLYPPSPYTISGTPLLMKSGQTMTIGLDAAGGAYFNGKLDDVRVYNRSLSSGEIADIYNMGIPNINAGLVGWWKFDEASGTSAADSSGNAITGTLVNTPTWVAGKINNALNFDKASYRHVTLASNAALAMASGSFTFAAWINPTAFNTDAWHGIIGCSVAQGASYGIADSGGTSRRIKLTRVNSVDFATGTQAISTGAWQHVAVVMNRARTSLTYYLNGVAETITYDATTFDTGKQSDTIGTRLAGTDNYFDGKIDDVRIYNRALSAADVAALYAVTAPA